MIRNGYYPSQGKKVLAASQKCVFKGKVYISLFTETSVKLSANILFTNSKDIFSIIEFLFI
jgi:hypothetical protein